MKARMPCTADMKVLFFRILAFWSMFNFSIFVLTLESAGRLKNKPVPCQSACSCFAIGHRVFRENALTDTSGNPGLTYQTGDHVV